MISIKKRYLSYKDWEECSDLDLPWVVFSDFPQAMVRGIEREEFEEWVDESVEWMSPSFQADDREEDVAQAIKWYYTHWPDVDDPEWNRQMAGRVCEQV